MSQNVFLTGTRNGGDADPLLHAFLRLANITGCSLRPCTQEACDQHVLHGIINCMLIFVHNLMSLFYPLCYILQHILSIFIKILINYDSTYVESCLLLLEVVLKGKKGFDVCKK